MSSLIADDLQITTDLCNDTLLEMGSTQFKTVCLLPRKDVTLHCALPDNTVIWSSPDLGTRVVHGSSPMGMLGSNIHLQYESYDLNNRCIRAIAIIVDIEKTMNGLELTCGTPIYIQCRSIFSTIFTVNVIGKKL